MSHPAAPDQAYVHAIDQLYALGQELAPAPPLADGTPAPRRKWDLAHMRTLSAALGDPQNTFPSILIAGTNGKGSTASTLASILSAAGYKTGLYTSPHLSRVNERIQILPAQHPTHNVPPEIPDPAFARLFSQVDDTAIRLISEEKLPHHPSFFEVLTALAFLYFAEEKVDIAILEVGLGGRLDATNIVDPLLSVLTDIALDHQDYLGNTIAEITREKAGILRANGTLITLPQHPEANQAIGEAAALLNLHAISAADFIPVQLPSSAFPGHPHKSPAILSEAQTVILSEASCNASPQDAQSKDPLSLLPLPVLSHPPLTVILSEASCNASPQDAQSKDLLLPLPLPVLSHPPLTVILSEASCNALPQDAQSKDPFLLLPLPVLSHPPQTVILSGASCNASPQDAQSKDPLLLLPLPVLSHPPQTVILSEASCNASPQDAQSKDPEGSSPTSTSRTFQPQNPNVLPRNRYTLTLDNALLEVDSPLSGHHQQRNIALAIATANALRNQKSYIKNTSNQNSYKIEIPAIEAGIRDTRWPGRLEFLPPNLLLDVAHNPAGAWTLRAAIARLPEEQPRTLLFSCLADKDLTEMSRILFPLFDSSRVAGSEGDRPQDHIVLAPIPNPRAAHVEDLLAAAHELDIPAHAAPHLAGALAQARAITPPGGLIIATGSVYLVGAIRDLVLEGPTE